MSKSPSVRGLPIAAHIALLVTVALVAAYVVNLILVVMLPPRPPNLVRADQMATRFEEAYRAAAKGLLPSNDQKTRWRIADVSPVRPDGRWRGRRLSELLANRLNLPPEKVVIAFVPFSARNLLLGGRTEPGPPPPRGRGEGMGRPSDVGPQIGFEAASPHMMLTTRHAVAAQLPNGKWLVMRPGRGEFYTWMLRVALSIGATLALVLAMALFFARRLASPIQRFALAAQRVGVDQETQPLPVEGPRELRMAANAVNSMQQRLRALVADRTEMLATVAHDLRTPLMRLRLAAENAEPALREKLTKEAMEIDALVSSFIAFAREDPAREPRVRMDFAALAQSVVDDRTETGARASYKGPDRLVLIGQSLGLKRLVANLVENALHYAGDVNVELRVEEGAAVLDVADHGPGVPEDERERIFKPFARGSASIGAGAGLGLASARAIARAHGGEVIMLANEGGGARARATIPLTLPG